MHPVSKNITIDPCWELLEALIGERCAEYMYIAGFPQEDGTVIHAYKHIATREYMNLSADGRQWIYMGGGYSEVQGLQ